MEFPNQNISTNVSNVYEYDASSLGLRLYFDSAKSRKLVKISAKNKKRKNGTANLDYITIKQFNSQKVLFNWLCSPKWKSIIMVQDQVMFLNVCIDNNIK